MMAPRWIPQDIEELRKLHASGLTPKQIAAKLGRSKNSIMSKLWRLGLCDPAQNPILLQSKPKEPRAPRAPRAPRTRARGVPSLPQLRCLSKPLEETT